MKRNSIAQGHQHEHGLDTRCAPMRTDLPEIWHNTPSQYIECTCKLITNISTMTNNIMIFKQISSMQNYYYRRKTTIHAMSPTDSLTRRLPRNQTVTIPGSQLEPITHEHLECSCFRHEPKHHSHHLVCKIYEKS